MCSHCGLVRRTDDGRCLLVKHALLLLVVFIVYLEPFHPAPVTIRGGRAQEEWVNTSVVVLSRVRTATCACSRVLLGIISASKHLACQVSQNFFMALSTVLLSCLARIFACHLHLVGRLVEVHAVLLQAMLELPAASDCRPAGPLSKCRIPEDVLLVVSSLRGEGRDHAVLPSVGRLLESKGAVQKGEELGNTSEDTSAQTTGVETGVEGLDQICNQGGVTAGSGCQGDGVKRVPHSLHVRSHMHGRKKNKNGKRKVVLASEFSDSSEDEVAEKSKKICDKDTSTTCTDSGKQASSEGETPFVGAISGEMKDEHPSFTPATLEWVIERGPRRGVGVDRAVDKTGLLEQVVGVRLTKDQTTGMRGKGGVQDASHTACTPVSASVPTEMRGVLKLDSFPASGSPGLVTAHAEEERNTTLIANSENRRKNLNSPLLTQDSLSKEQTLLVISPDQNESQPPRLPHLPYTFGRTSVLGESVCKAGSGGSGIKVGESGSRLDSRVATAARVVASGATETIVPSAKSAGHTESIFQVLTHPLSQRGSSKAVSLEPMFSRRGQEDDVSGQYQSEKDQREDVVECGGEGGGPTIFKIVTDGKDMRLLLSPSQEVSRSLERHTSRKKKQKSRPMGILRGRDEKDTANDRKKISSIQHASPPMSGEQFMEGNKKQKTRKRAREKSKIASGSKDAIDDIFSGL
ncbi:unnamed protein product [Choristocarpus tenellus]